MGARSGSVVGGERGELPTAELHHSAPSVSFLMSACLECAALGRKLRPTHTQGILVIPGARYGLDFLFMRLGQRTLAPIMGRVPEPEDMTLVKWREACWKMLTYTGLAVFGAFVVNGEPWVADTQRLWLGWPAQQHSRSLVFWYCAEFGLYGYGLVDLLVWEAMRNDYFAMIIHHVSTLSLLFGSYYFGFLRIGVRRGDIPAQPALQCVPAHAPTETP